MLDFLAWLFWTLALCAVALALAYRRVDLRTSTATLGIALLAYFLLADSHWLWILLLAVLWVALATLNFGELRRERITAPLLRFYKTLVPQLSATEREALEAGTVWWDGELFTGLPDWSKLAALPPGRLSDEERAFLDGPTHELCQLLDDWEATHELGDMPRETWEFIVEKRFFAMIIPKRYGGLEFSPLAVAAVLAKVASRSGLAASTIGVPNSLGPAELLLHYGTDAQKDHYLPRLARGEEIPCFALTSPRVGSDAASILDTGIVCRGTFNGEEVIGIRLNWDKRYITLAPIATVLGLAFKLHDPEHLLGEQDDYGITAALIPTNLPGIEIGRRHFPINVPFQNGPTRGRDVFVPLDYIIGGRERAGQGWRMLMDQLAAGRGVVLPANAMGGARAAAFTTGAYARIRRQFNLPIAQFEGVGEALARITGFTYIINAAVTVTCTVLGRGEKPAVPSAILKYHCTEFARRVSNDAMDVHGGKGIMLGPKNYLARSYQILPVAITVEGANILTRSLIIFGQGAVRCHPFVLKEMEAAQDPEFERALVNFDRHLFGHIGYAVSNAARSFWLALTHARYSNAPNNGPTERYYQHINRFSAAFALSADVAMLTLGGSLKRREMLSARLGDVFSAMYLSSMVLKHYENQGQPAADLPLVEWACRTLLYHAQEQLHGFLRNLPDRRVAIALRALIFPRGRMFSAPPDDLGQQLVALISRPTETRERLCAGIYAANEADCPLGLLQRALERAEALLPIEERIREAIRSGLIDAEHPLERIDSAERQGIINASEADQMRRHDALVMELVAVDDFDSGEIGRAAGDA
ncbi:MAG: acyl-CoA dehydrogenase [Nevskiales bacterium]